MANGKIIQLKELDDLSTPIYPVTKADAVYLQNGSLLTDYLRGFPQTTIGAANQPIYLNNGVLTAGNEVYSKQEIDNMNTYTTGESWTGKYWINGKKIYQRYCDLSFTHINNQWQSGLDISSFNCDYIVNITLYGDGNYSSTVLSPQQAFYSQINGNILELWGPAGYIGYKKVLIEYTKK